MKKKNYKKNMRIKKVLLLFFSLICFFSFSKISFGAVIGSTIGGRDYGSTTSSLNNGLVGYWTFNNQDMLNGAVRDKSGNGNTGNLINISTSTFYTSGKLGQGFRFDGVNDRVTIPSSSVIDNLGPMTVSVWINPKVNGNVCAGCGIVTKDSNFSNGRWILSYSTGNVISFAKANTGVVARSSKTNSVFRDKWQHVVATWDGLNSSTGIKIFVDGTEVASYNNPIEGSGFTSDAGLTLNIGSRGAGSQPFNGLIDDVRIYNRILSSSEIAQLSEQGQVLVGQTRNPRPNISSLDLGLVGYWTFNNQDMLNGAVLDKSGNGNTGNLVSISTSTFYTSGKLGQGFRFDGVNDRVNIPDSSSLNALEGSSQATVSFWLKKFTNPASSEYVVRYDGSLGRLFSVRADANTPLRPQWRYGGTGALGNNIDHTCTSATCSLPVNQWVLVTVVYNDPTSYIYINGVLKSQNTGSGGALNTGVSTPIVIGQSNSFTNPINAIMDDVRIYSRALSASEINQLYEQGQGLFVGQTQNPRPNISSLDSGLVGYWTFNNQDMLNGAVRDKSGNGNTGNLVNISTTTFYTIGKLGQAFRFKNPAHLVVGTTNTYNLTNDLTVSAWFKTSGISSGSYNLVHRGNASYTLDGTDRGYSLLLRDITGTDSVRFNMSGSLNNFDISYTCCNDNKWHHALGVKNGNNQYLYVDGVLRASNSEDLGDTSASGETLYIGRGRSTDYFDGLIDDVRIYSRALSASEIKSLYNAGN